MWGLFRDIQLSKCKGCVFPKLLHCKYSQHNLHTVALQYAVSYF
jgi:hypothetical protein